MTVEYAEDFRVSAALESEGAWALAERSIERVEQSICDRTAIDDEGVIRWLRAVSRTILGFFVVQQCGSLLMWVGMRGNEWLVDISFGVVLTTGAIVFAGTIARNIILRRKIRRDGRLRESKGCCVIVEDASTYGHFKLVPDDAGVLWIDGARKAIVIEGLLFRYVLFASDIREIELRRSPLATGAAIRVRVGERELWMVVSEWQWNLWEGTKQLLGRRSRLQRRIEGMLVEQ